YLAAIMIYTLSLHDALPILKLTSLSCFLLSALNSASTVCCGVSKIKRVGSVPTMCQQPMVDSLPLVALPDKGSTRIRHCCVGARSEEHTSELQSRFDLVCRL